MCPPWGRGARPQALTGDSAHKRPECMAGATPSTWALPEASWGPPTSSVQSLHSRCHPSVSTGQFMGQTEKLRPGEGSELSEGRGVR